MRGLAICVAATAWAAGGCWSSTKTSSTGSFVSDVRIHGDELSVRTCTIDYEVTEHGDILGGGGTEQNMSANDCSGVDHRLPPGIDPPPVPTEPVPTEDRYLAPPGAAAGPLPPEDPAPPLEVILTGRARVAAAAGDCARVRRHAVRVKAINPGYYAATFVTDATLAPCLGGAP